ncbi:MAG: hypothetical protein J6O13_00755 [Selenomonas sp.]|nr:hypothetical protein [Selenomonas sp.]
MIEEKWPQSEDFQQGHSNNGAMSLSSKNFPFRKISKKIRNQKWILRPY